MRDLMGGKFRRVYHYHIRKTAGTSLNSAFWALAGLTLDQLGNQQRVCRKGLVFVRHDRALIEEGHYFFANSHLPAHTLQLPADTFTVTILRNPLDRVLSHYRYLLWARDDPRAIEHDPFVTGLHNEMAWLGNSFLEFLDRIPRQYLLCQLFMFSADYDSQEAAQRIAACSAVCFTEHFSRDLGNLARELDLALEEKHERRFGNKLSLTPTDLDRARATLDPEFTLLEQLRRKLGKS